MPPIMCTLEPLLAKKFVKQGQSPVGQVVHIGGGVTRTKRGGNCARQKLLGQVKRRECDLKVARSAAGVLIRRKSICTLRVRSPFKGRVDHSHISKGDTAKASCRFSTWWTTRHWYVMPIFRKRISVHPARNGPRNVPMSDPNRVSRQSYRGLARPFPNAGYCPAGRSALTWRPRELGRRLASAVQFASKYKKTISKQPYAWVDRHGGFCARATNAIDVTEPVNDCGLQSFAARLGAENFCVSAPEF